ncbi:MAG: hypothetical protein ACOZAP_05365 [Pseudomonadota bacterium]
MQLLLDHPLWIVVIVVTILLHVAFFFGIRHLLRKAAKDGDTQQSHQDAASSLPPRGEG